MLLITVVTATLSFSLSVRKILVDIMETYIILEIEVIKTRDI